MMTIIRVPDWRLWLTVERRPSADYYGWHCWLHVGPFLVPFWRVDFSGDEQ